MSNRAEQKRRQAFLEDINAVQAKHGYHFVVYQAQPELRIEPLPTAQTQEPSK